MNETLYHVFSVVVIVAAVIFTIAVLVGIIWMIVKWRSPEVQELGAPVRQYLLDEQELANYREDDGGATDGAQSAHSSQGATAEAELRN